MIRLDKLLAHAGYGTRLEVTKLIKSNQVTINKKIATKGSIKVDLAQDIVAVNLQEVTYQKYTYLMLNKPAGHLCAKGNYQYPTVFSLIKEEIRDLFIVGRLDVDTTGLIFLTNDGTFSHNLISGKKNVEKEYLVLLKEEFDLKFIKDIETGISLKKESFKPAQIFVDQPNQVRLIIKEGKYHQVKKMMQACNNEVMALTRLRIGAVSLDKNLELGEYRHLTTEEVNLLQ